MKSETTYPIELLARVFLKSLFRENTEVANIAGTLILAVQQHLLLREETLSVLLLLRYAPVVLGLLVLQLLQSGPLFLQLCCQFLDLLLRI